jgi:hypothetical protein
MVYQDVEYYYWWGIWLMKQEQQPTVTHQLCLDVNTL